jgi:hypothetical protein
MTELLLENKDESKVDELIEGLLNEHKQTLLNKEQGERDVLDCIKMRIDLLENHEIPYYSEKYGVGSLEKDYLRIILITIEGIDKKIKELKKEVTYDSTLEELTVFGNEISEQLNKDLELLNPILVKLSVRNDKYNFEIDLWNKESESLEVITKCLNERKYYPDDFKFHKESFIKLTEKQIKIESQLKEFKEIYDIDKHQCLRIIKKINHICKRIHKVEGYKFIDAIFQEFISPFIKFNSDNKSISLDVK